MTSQITPETINVVVVKKALIAEDIYLYELRHESPGTPLPAFEAGAHIDVYAGDFVRQYSLCGMPGAADSYQIAVLREPSSRGGSHYMHDRVAEGARLRVGRPRNLFPLHAADTVSADHTVLLAGGIGITPLLSMAESLHQRGASFELHYYTRSLGRTAFKERLASCPFKDRVRFHHDDAPATRVDLQTLLRGADRLAHLYFCGPAGFISAVQDTSAGLQWEPARVHFERFAADPRPDADSDAAFTVRIGGAGRQIAVPAGTAITAALSEAGIDIPVSCEQGVCGTCLTGVLEGEVDHRDQYLTEEERDRNDQMTPCCSRAKGPLLVLDL